jgi:MoxR-like ATPase
MTEPNKNRLKYDGDKYKHPIKPIPTDPEGRKYYPYIPSPDLCEAINLAIALNRPLLLEGEPGCGKTMLADAIAYEFTHKYKDRLQGKKKWWPYYIWNVKSTERARNGLYTFDAVARLRDAQLAGAMSYLPDAEKTEVIKRLNDKTEYIEFGAFGKALTDEMPPGVRPILLIDEIDKADPDFANDLLLEIGRNQFEITEIKASEDTSTDKNTKVKIKDRYFSREDSGNEPIVIITSNKERPLPEAFLRRCLYYHVGFPDDEYLTKIVRSHLGEKAEYTDLINAAIEKMKEARNTLGEQPGSKLPGTSEVLDLLKALIDRPQSKGLAALKDLALELPLLGIVLKSQADQRFYQEELGITDDILKAHLKAKEEQRFDRADSGVADVDR